MKWMRWVPFIFFSMFVVPSPAFSSEMNDSNQSQIVMSELPQIFEESVNITGPEGFENIVIPVSG